MTERARCPRGGVEIRDEPRGARDERGGRAYEIFNAER